MTEAEAKALASELEHHKWWRVVRVEFEAWAFPSPTWAIMLQHRFRVAHYLIRGEIISPLLISDLNDAGESYNNSDIPLWGTTVLG